MIILKSIIKKAELLDVQFQLDMCQVKIKQLTLQRMNSENIYAFSITIPDLIAMRNWIRNKEDDLYLIDYIK